MLSRQANCPKRGGGGVHLFSGAGARQPVSEARAGVHVTTRSNSGGGSVQRAYFFRHVGMVTFAEHRGLDDTVGNDTRSRGFVGVFALDLGEHIQTVNDATKDGVFTIQVRCGLEG